MTAKEVEDIACEVLERNPISRVRLDFELIALTVQLHLDISPEQNDLLRMVTRDNFLSLRLAKAKAMHQDMREGAKVACKKQLEQLWAFYPGLPGDVGSNLIRRDIIERLEFEWEVAAENALQELTPVWNLAYIVFECMDKGVVTPMTATANSGGPDYQVVMFPWSLFTVLVYTDRGVRHSFVTHRQEMLNVKELLEARVMAKFTAACQHSRDPESTMPSPDLLDEFHDIGDEVLSVQGPNGCGFVKQLEPLIVAEANSRSPKLSTRDDFKRVAVRQTLADCSAVRDLEDHEGSHMVLTNEKDEEVEVFSCSYQLILGAIQRIHYLLARCPGIEPLWDFHGLVKSSWGYGRPDEVASFAKAQRLMTAYEPETAAGADLVNEATGLLRQKFAISFLQRHGRLPGVTSVSDGDLRDAWNQPIVRGLAARLAAVPLQAWAPVRFDHVLPFDTTPDTASLMGDKAIALHLDDIYHVYDARVTGYTPPGRARTDRRQLMQLLAEPSLDAGDAAHDFATARIDPTSLVFMLKTKKRQPNPVEEREFGYTTIRNRLALSTAERNVQRSFFDYVPEIMLGKTATAVDQDLERRDAPDRCLSFNVNLDYKKWCQEKTEWNTRGTTQFLNDIFGTSIYQAIHPFYGSVVYISADPALPPPELVFTEAESALPQYEKDELARAKIKQWLDAKVAEASRHWMGDQTGMSFMSDTRGVEGQCQKVWTVDTFADVSLAAHRLPDYIPIGEEEGPLARRVVSEAAQRFMTELIYISDVMGKPFKPMETWLDDELYLFGK
ncbi:hypothetical protein FOZ60_004815 [Perkinsus olseni]|uniref:RdRp catalytic domain-containing protein n=1 Tax=Perkinsus olseni TaxID=32597 RepID=A0A7J6NSF7_PEROL|nr:hypothetical protein FOZ60_004815 [Perkinsus olseni]